MIERLVMLGMLRRDKLPDDRRVRLVNLTAKDRKIAAGIIEARQGCIEKLAFSFSEEEHETWIDALRMLTNHTHELDTRPKKEYC